MNRSEAEKNDMEGKTEEKKVGGFSRLSKSSRFLSELYTGRVEGFLGVKVLTERVAPELEVMIRVHIERT